MAISRDWLDKLRYSHTVKCCPAVKRDEMCLSRPVWRDLQDTSSGVKTCRGYLPFLSEEGTLTTCIKYNQHIFHIYEKAIAGYSAIKPTIRYLYGDGRSRMEGPGT